MEPRPAHRLAPLFAAVAAAALLSACPRPGAVAPGGTAAPRPGTEPVPVGSARPVPTSPPPATPAPTPTASPIAATRGIAGGATSWLFYTGPLAGLGSLTDVAARYRLIAIDADPATKKATAEQIATLRSGGRNQVLGWLELGSMDPSRPFWQQVGEGNPQYWLGPNAAMPGAQWLDLSNATYLAGVTSTLAGAIAKAGVDGFLLDHVDLADHTADAADGPCGTACRQGVLDAIARVRQLYPDKLLVVRGGTSDVLRLGGSTRGGPIAGALDGVVGVDAFGPAADPDAARELAAWRDMQLTVNGKPFFLGTDDRVPACAAGPAKAAADQARAAGLVPGVRDAAGAGAPCRAE